MVCSECCIRAFHGRSESWSVTQLLIVPLTRCNDFRNDTIPLSCPGEGGHCHDTE